MIGRRSLIAIAAILTPSLATAQACLGSISAAENTRHTYAGGTLDIVDNANAFGGRFGLVGSPKNRQLDFHIGARSISGGSKSILAADIGYSVDLVRKEKARACVMIDMDFVNLSDGDNGYADVMFGLGYGGIIRSATGATTFMPFGVVGGSLKSTGESELGDFNGWFEAGFGFRIGNGTTFTPSLRQSLLEGADPVIRLLVMFPISTGQIKPK